MKLKDAAIDILIGQDSTTINIYDREAGVEFCEITLTPEQLSQALSRLSHTECTVQVRGLDKVGKKKETKPLTFKLPDSANYNNRKEIAETTAQKHADDGWIASSYFGSRESIYSVGKETWARTNQSRWVEIPATPTNPKEGE